MKLFISICAFVLFILNTQAGFSQKEIEVSGKKYMLHDVKKGETAYGLGQKYKVTQAELMEANPDMEGVLKSGKTIKIPVKNGLSANDKAPVASKATAAATEFYYHKVFKKQTLFSIARQYGITADELISHNPELTNGLIPGRILKIPVKATGTMAASSQPKAMAESIPEVLPAPKTEAGYLMHTVMAGETIYRLEHHYGVTREELTALNPFLSAGLKTGTQLRIPRKGSQATEALPETSAQNSAAAPANVIQMDQPADCYPLEGNNTERYKVALLLPLYLQGNDLVQPGQLNAEDLLSPIDFSLLSNQWITGSTDSTAAPASVTLDQRAESFIEFYEGALLALDSMQKQGMNIELCVFDAANQNMINSLLQLDVFRELNLIIGPVYPELQASVASFAAKNRIPMVSPLANTGTYEQNNPYYLKVNPSREYQVEQTASYIAGEFYDDNLILLHMNGNSNSTEARVAEMGRERLMAARQSAAANGNLFHEYNFQQQGLHGIKELMSETGENIFLIPSDNEAQVSVAVTNLNTLAEHYNVVLMGTSNFPKLKSIQTENYHKVRLRYLSPTYVDYNKPLVRRFISNYRSAFSGEPTQFSYQGFDVAYYFLSALYRYGKDFRTCLPDYPMELTQINFNFRKVNPMGGYMNHSLFVTAYERNFDVANLGTVASDTK
ncbi:MAG TPA: LysM peptidoglycan-binding domain-containing protein [Prolixibacteraceae bacterium]|nr:LysM peptidoglycan-binding domain-containing protein [Prolixibacteraceae bacterium]